MPEAAVNENNLLVPRENDVRRTRQISSMEPKAVAHSVKHASDLLLGLGILVLDPGHNPGPLSLGENIRHGLLIHMLP